MSAGKILVYGSIAFDVLFQVTQDFREALHVSDNKITDFNATYVSNKKQEYRGGTAGNMAYWLGELNTPATIFSSVGQDFTHKGYRKVLEDFGHTLHGPQGDYTAHCYQASDTIHQQLVIWQPNQYENIEDTTLSDHLFAEVLSDFEMAIFSPGTPKSTTKHLEEFRTHNKTATVILDPSQNITRWDRDDFLNCLTHSNILIGNESEFGFYRKMMSGRIPEHLHLIQTFGEKGVIWQQRDEIKNVPAQSVDTVVETTGAGDAFRAGLISGLINGKSFEESLQLGAQIGAEAVQCPGAQRESRN